MDFNFDTGTITDILELDPGAGQLKVLGSAGIVVPFGPTVQRPGTPPAGVLRFNTTLNKFEGFDGVVWSNVQVGSTSLTNISALTTPGLVVQTTAGNYAARTISGTASNITVSDGDGVAGNPTINLATAGTAGTYVTTTTDAFGRVTSGSTTQAWSTLTGTPTTLAGYAISDAVKNAGSVVSFQAGVFASRPTAGTAGRFYFATDTNATYYDTGSAWLLNEAAVTGDVAIPAGTGTATLATVNSNVGSFGSTTQIPVVTVNAKGLVTAVTTANISGAITLTGDATGTGSTGGNTAVTLATVNSNVGTYGDSSNVAQVTVNAKGLVTSVSNVAIQNTVALTGDVTASGTTAGSTAATLATVNSNVGFFGSNNQVATFTVNAKGLTTAAGNVTITPAAIGAINVDQLGVANGVATLDINGKLADAQIPAALVGAMVYQGIWNASTNTPALVSGVGTKGQYYKVSVAGTTTIDGHNLWTVGDVIVFNGTTWDAIDGLSSEVNSVFGRVGAVTATLASTDFANQGTTTTVLHGNANGAPSWGPISLSSDVSGTLPTTSFPALSGDVTTSAGATSTTLATVNTNIGTYGSTTSVPVVTVNGKGLVTGVTTATIPNTVALTGDGTASVTTGGSGALTLATVNATTGSFGSNTQVATFTVNGKGLVTAAGNVTIPNTVALTGDVTATGTTDGSTAATLATVNSNIGAFGSATAVPVITVNGKGLVTAVSTVAISGAITVTGDATGTGTTGGNTAVTLATVNSNVGTFGSSTQVGTFTINAKGLVTAAGNVAITAAGTGGVTNAGGAPSIAEGLASAIGVATTAGALYVATDTKQIFRANGATWDQIGEAGLLYTENAVSPVASTVTGANAISNGSENTASGTATLATGVGAVATNYGAEVRANGYFTAAGDAQTGKYVLRNITTNATQTEVFLDGTAARIVLPNNSAMTYSAYVVGRCTSATGNYGAWKIEGLIRRDANAAATAMVGTRSRTTLTAASGWSADVFADATNGALTFKVTGAAGQTVRWVVTVITSEVTN
jgi:hypothetical protein